MLDLFKQFFSFKKFMKDRLVTSFFYLGLVVIVVMFLSTIRAAFAVMDISFMGGLGLLLAAFFNILFLFVGLRLACELMVTVFHINDNLSPDGGKSDLADIDPFATAREAAAKATKRATDTTKSAYDKTKSKIAERKDGGDDVTPDYDDPTPPKKKPAAKKKPVAKKKTVAKKTTARKTVAKKPAAKKPAAKKTMKRKPAAKPKK